MRTKKHLTLKKLEPPFQSLDDDSPLEWDQIGENLKEFWADLFKEIVE